jgi:hypothetical protein
MQIGGGRKPRGIHTIKVGWSVVAISVFLKLLTQIHHSKLSVVLLGEEPGHLSDVVAVWRPVDSRDRHCYNPVADVGQVEIKSADGVDEPSLVLRYGDPEKLDHVRTQRERRPDPEPDTGDVQNEMHPRDNLIVIFETKTVRRRFAHGNVNAQHADATNQASSVATIDHNSDHHVPWYSEDTQDLRVAAHTLVSVCTQASTPGRKSPVPPPRPPVWCQSIRSNLETRGFDTKFQQLDC